jgi:hypothetical protein
MGITPGHVQMMLLWESIADQPKKNNTKTPPMSRLQLTDSFQIPLRGMQAKL